MTDGPLSRKSLARIVVEKLKDFRKPCSSGCRVHASCQQDVRVQEVLERARQVLEQSLPRQNPSVCGTKHPWLQSVWQYGGRGEPLCGKCGHVEGGDCHQPPYGDLLGGCGWCGTLTGIRHKTNCPLVQAEHSCRSCTVIGCKTCLRCRLGNENCEGCRTRVSLVGSDEKVRQEILAWARTQHQRETPVERNIRLKVLGYARRNVVRTNCSHCGRPFEGVDPAVHYEVCPDYPKHFVQTGRLSTKESNLLRDTLNDPYVLLRYWEDKVVERIQPKLPPGYTAKPVREATLRDENAKVQICDSKGVSYAAVYEHWQHYMEYEHGVIRRAWKRFLEIGV